MPNGHTICWCSSCRFLIDRHLELSSERDSHCYVMDSADDNRRSPAGIIVSTPSPHRLLPHRSSIPSSSAMLLPPPLSTAGLAAVKPLRAPALMTSPSPAALHGLHGLAASEAGLLMTASHNGLRSLPPKLTPANPEEVSSEFLFHFILIRACWGHSLRAHRPEHIQK